MGWGDTFTGGGMAGLTGTHAQRVMEEQRQEAARRAGVSEALIAVTAVGRPGGMQVAAQRRAETFQAARRAVKEAGPPIKYYGRPGGRWVAYNIMFDYAQGRADAEMVKRYAGAGAGPELGKVAMRMGRQILDTVPGASEVLAALDIADRIPLVGDLTGAVQDVIENIFGEGIEAIGDITGGTIDLVEEIPGVGDVVGAAAGVLKEIPLLGSLF